jgi:hypothetical protein
MNKVMVALDRAMQRRETPDGRKLSVLDLHSKVSTPIWAFRTCRRALGSAAVVLLVCLLLPSFESTSPCHHVLAHFARLLVRASQEAEEFRRSLIRYELEMLKAFGFITHVEHPHKLLLNYCQVLGLDGAGSQAPGQEPSCPVFLQEAWNVANDRWGAARVRNSSRTAARVRISSTVTRVQITCSSRTG